MCSRKPGRNIFQEWQKVYPESPGDLRYTQRVHTGLSILYVRILHIGHIHIIGYFQDNGGINSDHANCQSSDDRYRAGLTTGYVGSVVQGC